MIERDLLPHLPIVRAVARAGGFAAAAARLGLGVSAVSHAVRVVEDRLGQPLFARTTRSVAPTEAGLAFLAAVEPALEAIEAACEAVRGGAGRVTGTLRLDVPRLALAMGLGEAIVRTRRAHPDLAIEVVTDEGLVDIVAAGFDAGVRVGGMIAEDMVAVRLTPPFPTCLVASPAYLAARGVPRTIADLAGHDCIGYRRLTTGGTYAWELTDGDAEIALPMPGVLRVTDSLHARDLALAGCGIAYLYRPLVVDDLAAGRLVQVLPETAVEEAGLFVYFPRRAAAAPKLRALVEAVREVLADQIAARRRVGG